MPDRPTIGTDSTGGVSTAVTGGGGITVGAGVTGGVTAVGVVGAAAVVDTPCLPHPARNSEQVTVSEIVSKRRPIDKGIAGSLAHDLDWLGPSTAIGED